MGFKGGFAAFVDGYQRSSEAAANRARMEAQDKRAEESAQYQRTRDAAQDKRHATDDAYTKELRGRQRKDWDKTDNLDKIESEFRAEPDDAGATPAATPPVNTSASSKVVGPPQTPPSLSLMLDKLAIVPTAAGLTPYDKEMKLAKRLAQTAGGYERAQGIIARAKTMRSEGVLDTLSHLEANDPQAAWESFNSSGAARMPPGSKFVQDGKSKDPYTGVEKPTWKLVGQDGAVINPDVRGSVYANVFTPKERMAFESSRTNNDAKLEMAREKLEQAKFIAQMRVAANAGNRAAAGAGQQQTAAFDSLQGFDSKEAQSAATKLVDEAIAGSGKQLTPQQRADAIAKQTFALRDAYASNNSQRERARVFSNAARGASTPQEIAAVRARAAQSGYTPAEMAAIDPRFAPAAAK